jgi:hypothetical protein
MSTMGGRDLGHGVFVSPAERGELVVTSPRLDLKWKTGEGAVRGTTIVWNDQPYEVVSRRAAGAGDQWVLKPWHGEDAMRVVLRLDDEFVNEMASDALAERTGGRNRVATLVLMPILGLAPGSVQRQWQNEWFFPAERATWVSAILELLGGGFGVVQAAALAFGGEWFLPPMLRFLVFIGPFLAIEGLFRMAQQEPIGSVLGLPFKLLEEKKVVPKTAIDPDVKSVDEERGLLELVSPVNRTDWDHGGRLAYRGHWYALDEVDREGRGWRYRFTRSTPADADHRLLHLRPPVEAAFVPPRHRAPPPSLVRTTLVTAAVTLGPRPDQERWAGFLGVQAKWLTAASAAAELIGGLTNIGKDAAAGGAFFVLLDVFLVVEGILRLASGLGGRPLGSVFGFILRPLYRSSLPPPKA